MIQAFVLDASGAALAEVSRGRVDGARQDLLKPSAVLRTLRYPSPASSGSNFWLNDYVIMMIVNHFYHRMPNHAHLDWESINKRKPFGTSGLSAQFSQ